MNRNGANGITAQRSASFEAHPGLDALWHFNSVGEMRAAAPLSEESQRLMDDGVMVVGRQGLTIVDDLLAEGLTRPLPNWISVMELGHRRRGESGYAQRTMDLDVQGERQVGKADRVLIPIYATHDDFSFGARELAMSERVGQPLDTDNVEQATRNVNVAIEDQAINGIPFNVDGNTAPGLLTNPSNTVTYTGTNKAWDHASKTGAEIVADVLAMVAASRADYYRGPHNLYIPSAYATALDRNYTDGVTTFDTTVRERLEKIQTGGRPLRIREADMLPANRTALVQMTRNVIDVIVGQTPATLSWTNNNGFRRYWMVLACMIVRIKTDYDAKSGIVIGNTV